LESRVNTADTTAAHVNRAWTQLLSDLRVILRRLGESSAQQSSSAASQSLQSVGSFRRLLRSSSQLAASDGDAQEVSDELGSHLRERVRESSDLLLAVVNAVERGQTLSAQDKVVDELHGQLSTERDRSASLVDQVTKLELQLADAVLSQQTAREDLTQVTTQRDKARAALRVAQAQVVAGAAAGAAAGGDEKSQATAAAAVAAAQAQLAAQSGGVSAEELEDLREAKLDADKLAARRLEEIEGLRRRFTDLEALLNRERIDMRAPLPEQLVERSDLFQKLRQKQELSDVLHREKVAELERAQQALADAERQRVAELANVEQQHRAAVTQMSGKLRESETTLMRVRGERRALGLRTSELEHEMAHLKETKSDKDKYVALLQKYVSSLGARLALTRTSGEAADVDKTMTAAGSAMVAEATAGTDASAASTSALDQVVAKHELEALKRELNELRARASPRGSVDELTAKLVAAEAKAETEASTVRALQSELGVVCDEMDSFQQQLADAQAALSAKDDANVKLMVDKQKMRVAIQTSKEAGMMKQGQLDKVEDVLTKQKAALAAKTDELRAASDLLEQRRLLIVELEAARDAANAIELRRIEEDANVRARLDAAAQRLDEAKKTVEAHVESVNALSAKLARMREQASEFQRKWQAARAVNVGGQDEQVAYYREKLICNVCHDREKSTVISKCFHVFCGECVQQNLRDRHRKCPGCGIKFGEQDVHRLWLASAD
jgi:E3 ubiquitin-protein ligase BRE1